MTKMDNLIIRQISNYSKVLLSTNSILRTFTTCIIAIIASITVQVHVLGEVILPRDLAESID